MNNKDHSTPVDVRKTEASLVRKIMKSYWESWADYATESGTTMEVMVGEKLYSAAVECYDMDREEVMNALPSLKGMSVIELGGGRGRYSGELAMRARSVIATDLIETFVKENEATNGTLHPNLTFRTLDAAQLDYPPNTFDLIFSNWLLMYLNDEDTERYVYNNLMMLKPGGYAFLRESHFQNCGNRPQSVNPTVYRSLQEYHDCFSRVRYTDEHNVTYQFDFVNGGNCRTYVYRKANHTQVYYLWRKTKVIQSPLTVTVQQLLDDSLYNGDNMEVYDKVIGDGFVTPGGLDCSKELIGKLNIPAGSTVLDVGCGLGGLMTYLIKDCDIDTTGLDMSVVAIETTVLKLDQLNVNKGCVHIGDVIHTNFPENSFDVVFARETVEYVSNKEILLKKALRWLKPNGQLMLSEYCLIKEGTQSPGTAALIQSEGMTIVTTDSLIQMLDSAGFTNIKCEDYSQQYIKFLTQDLIKLNKAEIPDGVRGHFTELWQSLLKALTSGELSMNIFTANSI